MKKNNFEKKDILILFIILFLGLVFRLYKINTPLADFHSWRQADTAAVARNFIKNGFDLLHPRFDDLSSIQSGLENPSGYRFVEFPIYNALFAYLYKIFPITTLEITGRLVTIFFSLITIAIIYYLSLKESQRTTAVVAALVYALFPFFVFFSRVVLPDPTALSFVFLAIYFLYLFSQTKNKTLNGLFFVFSALFFACAVLVKPTTIFYVLTIIYLFYRKFSFNFFKKISFYLYFLLALFPFLLWRKYILNFPEGIPASDWLITMVNTYQGKQVIFFRPAFFRWIFFERINNLILGGYLTFLFILGILVKPKKYFFHSLLLSSLFYLFIFQGGNVQHEYYQIMILPSLALFVGLGFNFIANNLKSFLHPFFTYLLLFILFGLSFFFSFYKVKNYYDYASDLVQIAKITATLTKESDKIVTDRTGDTTLLYLMDRKGSPAVYLSPEEFKKLGYQYILTQNLEYLKDLKKKYPVIFENNNFGLLKL
jgi:4-amino-4-deoxy-L-arabinose transferase-like glycosyltransferase